MFFKSRTQRDIESFKTMQDGLRPSNRTSEHVEEMGDETIDSVVDALTSSASTVQHSMVSGEATWEGKLRTEASARIEGTISGEIDAGDTVFIAKGAHVRANVHARRVIVAGALEGQISCRERLVVEQSGRLEGKVSTETLVIEEGAVVQSQIQMRHRKEPTQAITKKPMSWEDTSASPLGKISSQRLKPEQAGSSEPKRIEVRGEKGGE